ncbi:glutathione S-transferase N-terminal domain-containing protein [Leptolyngbya sp. 15MV]|nr:glutathione S-transferase N-terminal domain-containing protein [Leptolyngbya sp. 15MV]
MKLHHSPASPFARKVMAVAIARGIEGRITLLNTNPHASPADLLKDNPLSKVPCLVTDDGAPLYDSRVICEYLDTVGEAASLFPTTGTRAWIRAQVMHALADGIMDAAVARRMRVGKPVEAQQHRLDRQRGAGCVGLSREAPLDTEGFVGHAEEARSGEVPLGGPRASEGGVEQVGGMATGTLAKRSCRIDREERVEHLLRLDDATADRTEQERDGALGARMLGEERGHESRQPLTLGEVAPALERLERDDGHPVGVLGALGWQTRAQSRLESVGGSSRIVREEERQARCQQRAGTLGGESGGVGRAGGVGKGLGRVAVELRKIGARRRLLRCARSGVLLAGTLVELKAACVSGDKAISRKIGDAELLHEIEDARELLGGDELADRGVGERLHERPDLRRG